MAVNEDYDRLRVVIETLAYAQPEMQMKDAVGAIFTIEERALSRPRVVGVVPEALVSTAPGDVAAWINAHGHKYRESTTGMSIIDLVPTKKINAIKEVRGALKIGLKEAKEGVEEYQRMYR